MSMSKQEIVEETETETEEESLEEGYLQDTESKLIFINFDKIMDKSGKIKNSDPLEDLKEKLQRIFSTEFFIVLYASEKYSKQIKDLKDSFIPEIHQYLSICSSGTNLEELLFDIRQRGVLFDEKALFYIENIDQIDDESKKPLDKQTIYNLLSPPKQVQETDLSYVILIDPYVKDKNGDIICSIDEWFKSLKSCLKSIINTSPAIAIKIILCKSQDNQAGFNQLKLLEEISTSKISVEKTHHASKFFNEIIFTYNMYESILQNLFQLSKGVISSMIIPQSQFNQKGYFVSKDMKTEINNKKEIETYLNNFFGIEKKSRHPTKKTKTETTAHRKR